MLPAGSFCCLLEKVIFLLEKNLDNVEGNLASMSQAVGRKRTTAG